MINLMKKPNGQEKIGLEKGIKIIGKKGDEKAKPPSKNHTLKRLIFESII